MENLKLNKQVEGTESSKSEKKFTEEIKERIMDKSGKGQEFSELATQDDGIVEEIKELRTANETVYRRNDRTCRKIITAMPTRYRDKNGEFKKINNKLVDNGAEISNESNSFKVKFDKDAHSGKIFNLQKGNKVLELSSVGSAKMRNHTCGCKCELCVDKDDTILATLDDGTEIEYITLNDRIKENIIVKERQESYEYYFKLNIGDLAVEEGEHNALLLKDAQTGETEFIIPAPYMYDANKKRSNKVSYEIDVNGQELEIKVVADADFINAEERAFPVTIDPQIMLYYSDNLSYYSEYYASFNSENDITEGDISVYAESSGTYDTQTCFTVRKDNIFSVGVVEKVELIITAKPGANGYFEIDNKVYTLEEKQYAIDITNLLKANSGSTVSFWMSGNVSAYNNGVSSGEFYTLGEYAPVLEIEYITNENVKPTKKTISIAGGVVDGELDVQTGEFVSEFSDIDESGSLLGVNISHAYKKDLADYKVGKYFRLNLHERFEKNSSSAMDADYVYTDSKGIKHPFKDLYYYLNDQKQRVYVNKNNVTIDQDQVLSYTTGGKIYRIYKEQRTGTGLQAMTVLSDFRNCNLIEQRHEKVYEVEENIKQLNKQKESCTHNIAYYNAEKSRLGVQKELSRLQKNLQVYSNNMQDAQNKIEDYKKRYDYDTLEEDYEAFARKCEEFNKVELEYRFNKKNMPSVCGDFKQTLKNQSFNSANDFHTARQKVFEGHSNYIDDDANENAEIKEVINYHYTNYINELKYELQKIINDAQNQTYDSKTIKEYLLYAQKQIVSIQKTILGTNNYDTDFDAQIAEIDYSLKQARQELSEINTALLKAEHEHKLLLRQAPVNYLTDGTIYKGFNQYGDLVVIYDSYDNTVAIEYEDCDLSESGEDYRICALSDNDENRITFDYNDDGLLTSITDKRGRKTKYFYDSNKYLTKVEYSNGKTITIEYSGSNIVGFETSDKFRSEMTYSSSKLSTIKTYSLTTNIMRRGANSVSQSDSTMLEQWLVSYVSLIKTVITLREKGGTISDSNKTENIREYYIFNSDGNNTAYYLEEYGKVTKAEKYTYQAYVRDRVDYAQKSKLNVSAYTDNFAFGTTDYEETILDEFNNPKTSTKFNYVSATNSVTAVTTYTYDDNHKCEKTSTVTTVQTQGGSKTYTGIIKYNYNAQGKVVRAESYIAGEELTKGKSIEETVYDKKGNVVKSFTYNSLDSSTKTYTESEYAENGQVLADFDETGENKTKYEYIDGTDAVRSKQLPNGSKFTYGYDVDDSITSITQSTDEGEENSTRTLYTCGQATELVSGNNRVQYTYDYKRRLTAIGYNGNAAYETYEYTDGATEDTVTVTNALQEVFATVSDKRGNILRTLYNGNPESESDYNSDGTIREFRDKQTGAVVSYTYDTADRKLQRVERKNYAALTEESSYTKYNEIHVKTLTGAVNQVYTYTYNENSSARELDNIALPNGLKYYPQRDVTERNTGKELKDASGNRKAGEYITYRKVGDHATNMPAAIYFGGIKGNEYIIRDHLKYSYDESGNICKITENGELYTRYAYDGLNRLVREDNKKRGKTYVYEYDGNGNILSKKQTAFTLREDLESCAFTTVEYGYDGDRLMSYGNETFEYDDIGNPKKYRGLTLEWEKGRQLAQIGDVVLKYDAKGRRVKRGGVEFIYDDGGNLLKSSDGLEFYYDEAGVSGVKYNGTQYLYRKDAQGNIVAILDMSGNVVVKYTYDAWGNHDILDANGNKIEDVNHIGIKNPFRYRGYYYDEALDLYYLQTRYYDAELGRFINIDGVEYIDEETINGLNLYAYCGNNPVNNVDPTGHAWWHWLLGAVGVVLLCAIAVGVTALTGGTASLGFAVALGALKGSAIGLGVGAVVGVQIGAIAGGIYSAVTGADFWSSVGKGALLGLGIGAFAGAVVGAVIGGVAGYSAYTPSKITGFTEHGLNQVIQRNGHGVSNQAILDTVKSPVKIVKQGKLFKSTYKFISNKAVVVLNKAGKVVTAWAKKSLWWRF